MFELYVHHFRSKGLPVADENGEDVPSNIITIGKPATTAPDTLAVEEPASHVITFSKQQATTQDPIITISTAQGTQHEQISPVISIVTPTSTVESTQTNKAQVMDAFEPCNDLTFHLCFSPLPG